jgi:alpha-glucosidase
MVSRLLIQRVLQFVAASTAPQQLDVEVFPDTRRTSFEYYDDDGLTYNYENNEYFAQTLSVERSTQAATLNQVTFETAAREGKTFTPALQYYLVKIHGPVARNVSINGTTITQAANLAVLAGATEGWLADTDPEHGGNLPVTYVRLRAGVAQSVVLTTQ